ncbi:Lysophospholipase L1 [Kosakonia sacchari]|nr:Lysophospholipase L1 [Kosakonia sacchari]
MPMTIPATAAAARGSSENKALADWLSQLRRNQKLDFGPVPVMSNPPAYTLTKGTGLSAVSISSGGTGYTVGNVLTVVGGTSAAAASITVVSVSSEGAITAAAVGRPGVYTATPANPASVTGGSGTGAIFNLTWNAGVASSIYNGATWSRSGAWFSYLGSNIANLPDASGYMGNGNGNGTQCAISFCSDAPALDFRLIGFNCQYDLYVDGQRISSAAVTTDTSGAPYIYTIDWGGVVKTRTYTLRGVNTAFGGVIVGQAYTLWAPTRWRPTVWQLGDSYTFGTMASQSSFNDFRIICDTLGFDGLADGVGGSGWVSTGSTQPQQRIKSKLWTLTRKPEYVFLSLGYNDWATTSIALLQTNFTESVALIKQHCPEVAIVVIGPATPIGSNAQLNAIRSAIMALCSTLGLPFIDVSDWVNARNKTLYTAYDNVHPNDAGYAFRAARLSQALLGVL